MWSRAKAYPSAGDKGGVRMWRDWTFLYAAGLRRCLFYLTGPEVPRPVVGRCNHCGQARPGPPSLDAGRQSGQRQFI